MLAFPRMMTAMATPFAADGSVDLDGVQELAAHLVANGNEGLVVVGTTGESPTLDHQETLDVFRAVVSAVGDRATVVAGCGKNDTAATVALVREASDLGVDGILLVTPYYNRPSQRGLVAHFTAASRATDLPVMLYNIPSRSACEIAPETLLGLAEQVDNVKGVKDAVVDFAKTAWLAARAPDGFGIWSGDDSTVLPLLAVGGVGVVSVAGHLVGDDLATMIEVFPSNPEKAREIAFRIAPLCSALFVEPSPAPLKAALRLLGLPAGPVRAPLVEVEEATLALVREALRTAGVVLPDAEAAASPR
jgi:4-hydroxy-tetrahydrodipicolinate synthase